MPAKPIPAITTTTQGNRWAGMTPRRRPAPHPSQAPPEPCPMFFEAKSKVKEHPAPALDLAIGGEMGFGRTEAKSLGAQ